VVAQRAKQRRNVRLALCVYNPFVAGVLAAKMSQFPDEARRGI